MMIFDQNRQTVTKSNRSYVVKQFVRFWTKRAYLTPETLFWVGL